MVVVYNTPIDGCHGAIVAITVIDRYDVYFGSEMDRIAGNLQLVCLAF